LPVLAAAVPASGEALLSPDLIAQPGTAEPRHAQLPLRKLSVIWRLGVGRSRVASAARTTREALVGPTVRLSSCKGARGFIVATIRPDAPASTAGGDRAINGEDQPPIDHVVLSRTRTTVLWRTIG
jgi:hypothetical protein